MTEELAGLAVAFLVANEGVEEAELTAPWEAVTRAGGRPQLLAPEAGFVQCFQHLDRAGTAPVDHPIGDVDPADFDALVLPGGMANADQIRTDHHAVRFVREFFDAGKPVAVICHGEVRVDGLMVSSRKPDDLPAFCRELAHVFARAESSV